MCLHEEPTFRPLISDVVTALSYMSTETDASSGYAGSVLNFQSGKFQTVEDLLQY